jgi:hypothetical protein
MTLAARLQSDRFARISATKPVETVDGPVCSPTILLSGSGDGGSIVTDEGFCRC